MFILAFPVLAHSLAHPCPTNECLVPGPAHKGHWENVLTLYNCRYIDILWPSRKRALCSETWSFSGGTQGPVERDRCESLTSKAVKSPGEGHVSCSGSAKKGANKKGLPGDMSGKQFNWVWGRGLAGKQVFPEKPQTGPYTRRNFGTT